MARTCGGSTGDVRSSALWGTGNRRGRPPVARGSEAWRRFPGRRTRVCHPRPAARGRRGRRRALRAADVATHVRCPGRLPGGEERSRRSRPGDHPETVLGRSLGCGQGRREEGDRHPARGGRRDEGRAARRPRSRPRRSRRRSRLLPTRMRRARRPAGPTGSRKPPPSARPRRPLRRPRVLLARAVEAQNTHTAASDTARRRNSDAARIGRHKLNKLADKLKLIGAVSVRSRPGGSSCCRGPRASS